MQDDDDAVCIMSKWKFPVQQRRDDMHEIGPGTVCLRNPAISESSGNLRYEE